MKQFFLYFRLFFSFCVCLLLLTFSVWQPFSPEDAIRPFTRAFEFDYFSWTVNTLEEKISMFGLGLNHYLDYYQERMVINNYFKILKEKEQLESDIEAIYADPNIENPVQESLSLHEKLESTRKVLDEQTSLAEAIFQEQISRTLEDLDLASLGQPFPPVLFHITDLPNELIISPRNVIKQADSVSLKADIDLTDIVNLEDEVEANTDYSALVVSIGGVATYPTMVISYNNLSYLLETIAHEWTHNYLSFRPMGMNYSSSPEMRTINETTASITGNEVSKAVIRKYYSDLLPIPQTPYKTYEAKFGPGSSEEPAYAEVFDFNHEMYITRQKVDELLKQGEIKEAEDYMETRRQVFWDNGYQIRKLNQAYFAFHGAYADQPFGAAGADPVGEAVRTLRSHSRSLAEFIHKISGISSYDDLTSLINAY